ncbi:MAG: hypothetical protein H6741_28920 [Alphaproteobacteria bacterium]|nr:hypothetical protein [Alphaproteobacteria bacterium]
MLIHVDSDVCEEIGFDVSRQVDGATRTPDALAEAIEARLIEIMGEESYAAAADRVVFAVAVDEVECWLLPLLVASAPSKRSKNTGCLDATNHELHQRKLPALSVSGGKDSKAFRKRKVLEKHTPMNPSLLRLVRALERWRDAR